MSQENSKPEVVSSKQMAPPDDEFNESSVPKQQQPQHQPQQPKQKRHRKDARNHNRASVFRKWLVSTFSPTQLAFVLDVAGGSGETGIGLTLCGKCGSVLIIDPRCCDLMQTPIMKNCMFHLKRHADGFESTITFKHMASVLGQERLEKHGLPLPRCLNELFTESVRCDESEEMNAAKRKCTLVVGMHPDEATEPIVRFCLATGKPFAVLPCCVFPRQNPHRKTPEGAPVRTYEQFIEYLLALDPAKRIELHQFEEFEGRNVVLFHRGRSEEEEGDAGNKRSQEAAADGAAAAAAAASGE